MTGDRRYEKLEPIGRADAERAAARNELEDLSRVVIRVALHGDPDWAEDFVTTLSSHPDPTVRGNAVLAFGRLARLHGRLELARVIPIVRAALTDSDPQVRSHAESARDDIETFLGSGFSRE